MQADERRPGGSIAQREIRGSIRLRRKHPNDMYIEEFRALAIRE
jgi:hypothetical protein